jgi:hypothetical protein
LASCSQHFIIHHKPTMNRRRMRGDDTPRRYKLATPNLHGVQISKHAAPRARRPLDPDSARP